MPRAGAPQGDEGRILAFVRYFHDLEKKVGIAKIEAKLRELEQAKPQSGHTVVKNRILFEISRVYGLPVKTILHSTKRGNVTQTRVMAIILFHKHLKLNKTELADLFGHRGPNIISIRIKTFHNLRTGGTILESERRFEKVYSKDFMKKIDEVDAIISHLAATQTEPLEDWKKW